MIRDALGIPNLRTATSDAVPYCLGTIFRHGTLAITVRPFSAVINSALLYPPSFFSTRRIGDATEGTEETILHNSSRSNGENRFASSYSSLTMNRPVLYRKRCSGETCLPWATREMPRVNDLEMARGRRYFLVIILVLEVVQCREDGGCFYALVRHYGGRATLLFYDYCRNLLRMSFAVISRQK